MSKKATRLNKKDSHRLEEVATIVLSADNPTLALQDLESSLNGQYHQPLAVLRKVMEGDFSTVNDDSLFSVLTKLMNSGQQPQANYVTQYSILDKAQSRLYEFSRQNWGSMLYFLFMAMVYMIVINIYRVKVLPAFDDLFSGVGADLPPFTQFIMADGGFETVSLIGLVIAFIYYCLLPFLFRRALCSLRAMPRYLLFFLPTALTSRRFYHNYLWLVYIQVYQQAGEENPLQLAKDQLPDRMRINDNDWAMLEVACRHGKLTEFSAKMEGNLLKQLETTIKSTENMVRSLLFLLLAWMMGIPIVAMYMPLFQMGNVVQ